MITMDQDWIRTLLPHRAPMLMVDRLVELEPGRRAVGVHEVRHDAFWAAGHFPGRPILPGVLIAEALAQVGALLYLAEAPEHAGRSVYLVGFDKLRFRKPVVPACTLRMDVSAERFRLGVGTFAATATVDGERVADGKFMAALGE